MSDKDFVLLNWQNDEVAYILLNRPLKKNALCIALMEQLIDKVQLAEKKAKVILIEGKGDVFSSGLDLNEVVDLEKTLKNAELVKKVFQTIYQCRSITIALVEGLAIAAGAGIVACCDFAIASDRAKIGFPEVKRGIVPAQVLSILMRKIKGADIKKLLLTGEIIDAVEAKEIGLITEIEKDREKTKELIKNLLKASPRAITKTKRLIETLYSSSFLEDLEFCFAYHLDNRKADEAKEGIKAFLEKRKPLWDKS